MILSNHDNAEWDLLTAIVQASNSCNSNAIYGILCNDNYDFSDKPRCVHAAIFAIDLVLKNVSQHQVILQAFVDKISGVKTDLRTSFRIEVLKDLLEQCRETPA